ncbi:hypothetical protein C8R28_10364 [Nitrosomonas ureae]|uniref:Uncharacterized protein n=2 Tax=Nitrosomonas ureae TaxID=44577 RepID=A0A2T5IAA3_9PROT|nr:hypothetical protein C8R28_10364 [Nitrosomonas ureae]
MSLDAWCKFGMSKRKGPTMSDLAENKREMFDGMRAYHQSEISHAHHAITMLLAISAAAGAVVLAILFPQITPKHVQEIAWGLWVVVSIFAVTVAWTAHIKISSDHQIYARFGAEYVKTCELLGFYDPVEWSAQKTSIKTDKKIGQGKGYRKTQAIIWSFAAALIALTLLFALLIGHLV